MVSLVCLSWKQLVKLWEAVFKQPTHPECKKVLLSLGGATQHTGSRELLLFLQRVNLSIFLCRFPTVAVSIGFAVRQEVRVQPGPQGPFLDSLWPSFLSGFSLCVLGLQFTLFLNHDWQIQACGFEI